MVRANKYTQLCISDLSNIDASLLPLRNVTECGGFYRIKVAVSAKKMVRGSTRLTAIKMHN